MTTNSPTSDDRLDRIEQSLSESSARFDRIEQSLSESSIESSARFDRIERSLSTVIERLDGLTSDVEKSNEQFQRWDSRLWGLVIGLIGTAWAAIFAAAAVTIVRSLSR